MDAERGPDPPQLYKGDGEPRPDRSEPRRAALTSGPAQDDEVWLENLWRNEAYSLGVRVEELERQLRRRTLVLGCALVLMAGAGVAGIAATLFWVPPGQRHNVVTAPAVAQTPRTNASAAAGVASPVPSAVTVPPAARVAGPGAPTVPLASPERIVDGGRRAEFGAMESAPERDRIEPEAHRAEPRDTRRTPPANTVVVPPLPPLRADDTAGAAGRTPALRSVLSAIKRSMGTASTAGHFREADSLPSRLELAEPPLARSSTGEPTAATRQ